MMGEYLVRFTEAISRDLLLLLLLLIIKRTPAPNPVKPLKMRDKVLNNKDKIIENYN